MIPPTLPPELEKYRLLKDTEVAVLLGLAPQSHRNARISRKGPLALLPYRKMGSAVRYALADILAFSDGAKVEGK